jgi:polysaccharide pyruvyl transferase WcaK-like protein
MKYDDIKTMQRLIGFGIQDVNCISQLALGEYVAMYIGWVGNNNLGDELLYKAHLELFPDHKFFPYSDKHRAAIYKFARSIHKPFCRHAILGGGTLINDGHDYWVRNTEFLLEQGTKLFCLGTGVENPDFIGRNKITDNQLRRWVKALSKFEFIGVRGPQSKAILDNAGLKNVVIVGDTALALTKEKKEPHVSNGVVGVCFGDVKGNPIWGKPDRYRNELKKVIAQIINAGLKVRLLPIWDKDIPSNVSLMNDIDNSKCTLVKAFDSYDEYAKNIGECDIFIGQKLHSTIIAYMSRVPAIMIEYRPKCRDFMASLGLEDYVIKTSDFQLRPFMKIYDRLQKNYDLVNSLAESRILEYKHMQFERAKELGIIFKH